MPSSRRKFLQSAAIAAAAATAGGVAVALGASQANPTLIQSFSPVRAALSGGFNKVDRFNPTIAVGQQYMGWSTPESAWDPLPPWVAVAVPQDAHAFLHYHFAGRCITSVQFQAVAYLPKATAAAMLAAEPIYFQYSTDGGATYQQCAASVSGLGLDIYNGPTDAWYRFTWSGSFPTGTTDIRAYFWENREPYWIQAGEADFQVS